MSGDVRDFENNETRAVIKFFFPLQGKAPKKIHAILIETLGEHVPSYATVKNWVAQFKRGDFLYFTRRSLSLGRAPEPVCTALRRNNLLLPAALEPRPVQLET
jgi:hypothetical protein